MVRGTFSYDAYGNIVGATGSYSSSLRYAGQYADAESGLIYLRARYYDPVTGQFMARDPMLASTRSPYGYVGDNPLNSTDPSGLIDKSQLSASQINQINKECSTWQNQSLCTQAAFCAEPTYGIGGAYSGGDCRKIAEIAWSDAQVVQAGLANAQSCGEVELMDGYEATRAAAERDLVETEAAFNVAVEGVNAYNASNQCTLRAAQGALFIGAGAALSGSGLVEAAGSVGAIDASTSAASAAGAARVWGGLSAALPGGVLALVGAGVWASGC